MDKWQKRMEKVTANAVHRALQQQKKNIINAILSSKNTDKKDFSGYILEHITAEQWLVIIGAGLVVDAFLDRSKNTMARYYNEKVKTGPKTEYIGIDFDLPARPEAVYFEALKNLHLSNHKGSINATTIEKIQNIVVNGITEGKTRKEIAQMIEGLNQQVFSKNRADLIAINQIHKAKNFGEWKAMKEYVDDGYIVFKEWIAKNDNRVTKTHLINQGEGWIPFDGKFSGTNDSIPPARDNPRCRCVIGYEMGDKKGRKQPIEIEQMMASYNDRKPVQEYIQNLEKNYNYSSDTLLQNANENFYQGGYAQKIFMMAPKEKKITEEESIAIDWYKTEQFYEINMALRHKDNNTLYNGMILNLNSALYKMDVETGRVWRGIHYESVVKTIEKMQKGDIITESAFMSASKKREIAESYASGGVLINIRSKNGKRLGEIDASNDGEILFHPGTSLIFQEKRDGVYYFTEL